MFLEAPGAPITAAELTISKASDFVTYLSSGKHGYSELLEIRCDPETNREIVVFDVAVEISQDRVNSILDKERIAVSFDLQDAQMPEVVSLRPDFPLVPHLNQRENEFPRSLCLYELPYSTVKLRWTPTGLVERIRQWLSLTSEGKLHQEDQPLEHLFLGAFPPLILPSDFLQTINREPGPNDGATYFGVHAVGTAPQGITGFVVTNPKLAGMPVRPDHVATAVLAPPQKHGVIRNTPTTLREVIDVMSEVNVDLLDLLRRRIRQWRDADASVIGARLLLILIFPKMREEGRSEETWEWDMWGFLLLDQLREVGSKIGIWEVTPGGTIATLIVPDEDKSADIAVQIVNPVTQLTKEMAARYNGTHEDQRKCAMVGVGALGSMTLMNLARKGFGSWSIIDDDLMMPHNGARHALPAASAGAPKVAGLKQLTDVLYEDTAVVAISRANILRAGTEEAALTAIFDDADVIVDCSADVAVARYLALDVKGHARRLSLFLSPSGEQLVLLLEDAKRAITLDTLEMQFYRLLLSVERLKDHYASAGNMLRYGRSCRDLSAVLSADAIALFAAIGSRAIERMLADEKPVIRVWKTESDCSVASFDAQPRSSFQMAVAGFRVVWDEAVVEKLMWLRGEKLPKETGGALLGCWDLSRKILYIVDVTGAPQDSVERQTAFIRGSKDLSTWIDDISRITGKAVEYIGEWHSHPDACSTHPSNEDRQVFRWIDEYLSIDGLPAVMLIVGRKVLRWISCAEGDGNVWNCPK
jgi:integrative and conjugative element protein (TIGR02256 family)